MQSCNGRTRKALLAVAAIIACSSALTYAFAQSSSNKITAGPYHCNTCVLGYPNPSSNTKNNLISLRDSYNLGKTTKDHLKTDDIIILCNGNACVEYKITDSGNFYGVEKKEQENIPPPPASGGGTGDSPGSGGGPGGNGGGGPGGPGGCYANCTGVIELGA